MTRIITVIPGDGIGPEVTSATLEVLRAAGAALEYDEQIAGVTALERVHNPLPDETLESIRRNRVVLKGPLTTPVGSGFRSINVAIRKEFDLHANVRPARTIVPGGCASGCCRYRSRYGSCWPPTLARVRAAEVGRYMLRATNTGVTAVIDNRGVVVQTLPQFHGGRLEETVYGYTGSTPYVRVGNYLVVLLALVALAAVLAAERAAARRRKNA